MLIAVIVAALGVVSYVAYVVCCDDNAEKPKNDTVVKVDSPGKGSPKGKPRVKKDRPRKVGRPGEARVKKVKPTFDLADDEESRLSEAQKAIIEEIRAALDRDDEKTLCALVQKMQASDEWPDGIPKSIRLTAIEALGWFGVTCLPEIAGFLVDGDEEILQSAFEKYEQALSDFDLSDRERSVILVQAAKCIRDPDSIDSMLFELNNMRHSVAVSTIKTLMGIDSASLKSVLSENVAFYTGEEGMDTPEKLDAWLLENPDDEFDEELYGGVK